jgi:hypothetical protein
MQGRGRCSAAHRVENRAGFWIAGCLPELALIGGKAGWIARAGDRFQTGSRQHLDMTAVAPGGTMTRTLVVADMLPSLLDAVTEAVYEPALVQEWLGEGPLPVTSGADQAEGRVGCCWSVTEN